jgi:acetyl esterase/lipase
MKAESRLAIWPGPPPGSEAWTWNEQDSVIDGERLVRNVSVPTLEVFASERHGSRTAVIVAPGGAYSFLAIDHEGIQVARWLAARGITALLLRYRVRHTPEDDRAMVVFSRELGVRTRTIPWTAGRVAIVGEEADRAARLAMAYGLQAVRFVRAQADTFRVGPERVGMVGFSAGAGVVMAASTSSEAGSRPDFAAAIYGPRADDMAVPDKAPPLFLACALDDPAVPPTESVSIWDAWQCAGRAAELHVFDTGGHGFGMKRLGLAADAWTGLFERWLDGRGL